MVLAHAGHWLTDLIYVAPVAVVLIFIGVQRIKDKRSGYVETFDDDDSWDDPRD